MDIRKWKFELEQVTERQEEEEKKKIQRTAEEQRCVKMKRIQQDRHGEDGSGRI